MGTRFYLHRYVRLGRFAATALFGAVPGLAFAADAPRQMSVEDYLLDRATIPAGQVAVEGGIQCVNPDYCALVSPATPTEQVILDTKALAREDRRTMLHCNIYTSPCRAVVTFTHAPAAGMLAAVTAVPVTAIEWEQPPKE